MHKVINYGSFFQAYALQHIIQNLGHECIIIDYEYPNEYQYLQGVRQKGKRSLIDRIIQYLGLTPARRKYKIFHRAWKTYFILSKHYASHSDLFRNPPIFDYYITGSDQVWNPNFTKGDNAFFLEFTPLGSRRISYASSFSVSQIDEPYYSQYTKYLLKYQYLSVRESSGKTLIKQMLGKDSSLVLDPTLLITSEQWIKFASSKIDRWFGKHYILVYLLNYAFHAEECVKDIVEKIRRNTGLDVIVISTKQTTIDSTKTIIDVGIEEFIHLFSNAEYVVTSSFHGTAFAINFGKRLVSVTNNKSLDDRQNSILRLLHLERCIATSADSVDIVNCETLCARSLLDELRSDSINYLKKTLS